MKIALIGNMNNNHFAFMRYLRDLGCDAHLYLYKNEQAHFHPSKDTWHYSKWKEYIHKTNIINGISIKNLWFSTLWYISYKIKKMFLGFDFIICNGAFPIYAKKANLSVDYFLPYHMGIEHLEIEKDSLTMFLKSLFIRRLQLKALNQNVKYIATVDLTESNLKNFKYLKHKPLLLGIPMIYTDEIPPKRDKENLLHIIKKLRSYELVVFSHVRHIWKNIPSHWVKSYKQNDILIMGFAKYIKQSGDDKAILVLTEYGPDIHHSKELIQSLKIENHVLWLPSMIRREIMILLDYVDLGGCAYGGGVWGGVGWEFMSKGIPFFHYLEMDKVEFEEKLARPFPEIINTNSPDEICSHLAAYRENKEKYKKMGQSLKSWFDKYSGRQLVMQYVDMMKNTINSTHRTGL